MPDMCKLLDEVEKKLYIQGLAYVLGMNKQDPKQKKEYLLAQMAETGLSESEYKKIKCNCKTDALIKDLEQITDIRAKRYILREMILLAVADHELQDEEVEDLHKIGKYYYCFAADGTMLTGWHRIHNRFRYFGKQTGRMRINQTVNGRKINSKGVWTPVVVLDPGHSAVVADGYEPLGPGSGQMKEKDTSGTQGVATGVEEYKLNLSIGLQLRTLLQKRGFKVIMTRTNSKVALSCIDRAKVANKANADAYIRIHANGSDNSSISGALTICTTRNSPYISSMYRKNKALSEAVLNAYVSATGCRKEYVWETDSMTGNNWSKVPTTIIEMGYMSNPSEDRRMQQNSYQKKMVRGIANGIENYLIK